MSVEGNVTEYAINSAVENAAKPENVGNQAHEHLKRELESRPILERLEDTAKSAARQLAGEGLGNSSDAIRVASDLNVAAVMRYHENLLSRSQMPTEMRAVMAEVEALDPRRPIMTRSLVSLEIAESSGLWMERPDNLYLIKDDGNRPVFRHNANPQMINLGGYYFREDNLQAVRDGKAKYRSWADMRTGAITLPLVGGQVWNQTEQKFEQAFPIGAVECVSMPYFKFKELSDELDNPKQKNPPSKAPLSQVQPVIPPPLPSPVEIAPPITAEKIYSSEEYKVLKGEPHPENISIYKNVTELKAGGGTIQAPDHPNQDRFLVDLPIRNAQGEDVGRRYVVIDLAGGSLERMGLTPEQEDQMFNQKAQAMTDILSSLNLQTKNAKEALMALDSSASSTRKGNPVYGGAMIVDVYQGSIFFAWKQDLAAATYRPRGYSHRRGSLYQEQNFDRGGPGDFQLQNLPENDAHAIKIKAGLNLPTHQISVVPAAGYVHNSIGDGQMTPPQTIHLARPSGEGLALILASDGVQLDSSLIDSDKGSDLQKTYIDISGRLLNQVLEGTRPPQEVAWQICSGAQNLLEDEDDKTAIVVAVPPRM